MQIREEHLIRAMRALAYYRDNVVGHEDLVDEYDRTMLVLEQYRIEHSTD